jgi:phosphoglucomutase
MSKYTPPAKKVPIDISTAEEEAILERAKEWVAYDPNPQTRDWIQSLLVEASSLSSSSSSSKESLTELFGKVGRIGFGTAGLRGPMVPGPHGLNDLVVIQATQGIARYIQQQQQQEQQQRNQDTPKQWKAVIGYDHRCNPKMGIDSFTLACYAMVVLQHAGFEVFLLRPSSAEMALTTAEKDCPNNDDDDDDFSSSAFSNVFVPTPLVAFATRDLQCDLGIMITASHNPKQDNGYKVFWSDGCQIRSPIDQGIASQILQELIPWNDNYYFQVKLIQQHPQSANSNAIQKTCELVNRYFTSIKTSGFYTGVGSTTATTSAEKSTLKIAYTAMHGVGAPWIHRAYRTFHLPSPIMVPQQVQPDSTFPTVTYPNPEETGALSLAMHFAEQQGCSIILANDPDADRLAVAEYIIPKSQSSHWQVFQGKNKNKTLQYYTFFQIEFSFLLYLILLFIILCALLWYALLLVKE